MTESACADCPLLGRRFGRLFGYWRRRQLLTVDLCDHGAGVLGATATMGIISDRQQYSARVLHLVFAHELLGQGNANHVELRRELIGAPQAVSRRLRRRDTL